jgi:hypothetical protein
MKEQESIQPESQPEKGELVLKLKEELEALDARKSEASSAASSAYYSEDPAEQDGAEAQMGEIDKEKVLLAKEYEAKGLVQSVEGDSDEANEQRQKLEDEGHQLIAQEKNDSGPSKDYYFKG